MRAGPITVETVIGIAEYFLKRVIPGKCVLKVLLLTTWPSHTCARLLASKCALTNLKHGQVCNKRFKVSSGDVFCVIRLAGGHVISNNRT